MNDDDTFQLMSESLAASEVPDIPTAVADAVHQRVNRELTVSQAVDFATVALPHVGRQMAPTLLGWLRLTCGGGIEQRRRR